MVNTDLLTRDLAARASGRMATSPVISDNLLVNGYHVFKGANFPRSEFRDMYRIYDAIAAKVGEDASLLADWEASVSDWFTDPEIRRFHCGVPPVFRNRHGEISKRDKSYLQFCISYARSPEFGRSRLAGIPEVQELTRQLSSLHFRCVELFTAAVEAICCGNQHLRDRIQPPSAFSLVVIKMLRYNENPERFGTDPHFDKSALSLLLDSDDDYVRYRVARFEPMVPLSQFVAPFAYPDNPGAPSDATLISGLCLEKVGLRNFQASPHYVLPISGKQRHSIVAFLLVPGLEGTEQLSTQAEFTNDILPCVS